MTKSNVIIDVPLPDFLAEVFSQDCEFFGWDALEASEAVRSSITGILSYTHALIGDAEFDRLPNVRVVSNYGVGIDHIDVVAAASRGIPVGNTPGTVDGATADMTMALLLAVARNLVQGDRYARGPEFLAFDPAHMLGRDVFGATLGIIGLGRIGKEVAKRARGFDMTLLYHNRRRDPDAELALGAEYCDLPSLLARADFVSLNCPLTPETKGIIGDKQLRQMKPTGFLINTARGAVVDHDALYEALAGGWIAGAAIDVTEPEPLPRDHPLLALDNLIFAPHLGTSTIDTRLTMAEMTRANLVAGLRGEPLAHPV